MALKGALFITLLLVLSCCLVNSQQGQERLEFFNSAVTMESICDIDGISLQYHLNDADFTGDVYVNGFEEIDGCFEEINSNSTTFRIEANQCGLSLPTSESINFIIQRTDIDAIVENVDNHDIFSVNCGTPKVSTETLHPTEGEPSQISNARAKVTIQILNKNNQSVTSFKFGEQLKLRVTSENDQMGVIPINCTVHDDALESEIEYDSIFERKCSKYNFISNWQRVTNDPRSVESEFTGFLLPNNRDYRIQCVVDICQRECALPDNCTRK